MMLLVSELVFLLSACVLASRALFVAAGARYQRITRVCALMALPLAIGCAALTVLQFAARLRA